MKDKYISFTIENKSCLMAFKRLKQKIVSLSSSHIVVNSTEDN